jgi:hypothetical protein
MLFFLLSSADTLMKAKAYIRGFKEKIVGEVWLYQLSDMRVVLKGRVEGLGKYIFTNLEIVLLQVLNDPIGTHHSGDLPNITTDKNGVAEVRYYPNA